MALTCWGGIGVATVKHSASITYRKLTLPLVAATILANHAFNLTVARSIDRPNGVQRLSKAAAVTGVQSASHVPVS
jgi:hypothetical protein